ncbi:MAG: hypothetical protein K1W17_10475 [Oscillospiraceae bacterium]
MPRKVIVRAAAAENTAWYKQFPSLLNSLRRCADKLDDICDMNSIPGISVSESLLCELRKSLYLERFDGCIEAIEAFTGIHYNFTRTDEYYGICDDNEKFLYKVPRCQK